MPMVSAFMESFLVVEFCFYVLGIEPRTSYIQVLYPSAAELHSLSQGVLSSGARVLSASGTYSWVVVSSQEDEPPKNEFLPREAKPSQKTASFLRKWVYLGDNESPIFHSSS